jgi:hypothetical protein
VYFSTNTYNNILLLEIYQFETDSDAYKEIENSGEVSEMKVAAHNGGFALIFTGEEDADMVAKFKELKF